MNRLQSIALMSLISLGLVGCATETIAPPVAQGPVAPAPVVDVPPAPAPGEIVAKAPVTKDPASKESPAREMPQIATPTNVLVNRQAEAEAKVIEQLLQQQAQARGATILAPVAQPADPTPGVPQAPVNPLTQPGGAMAQVPAAPNGIPNVAPAQPPIPTVIYPLNPKPLQSEGTPGPAEANAGMAVAAAPANVPANAPAMGSIAIESPRITGTTPAIPMATQESLEALVSRRAHEYPRDLASQLDYQLSLFLKDESVPRAADTSQLTSEDREVLTAILDGLTNFRTNVRNDSNLLMGKKIRPLVDMTDRLRARADLQIPNAALCSEVRGFGLYTPVEPPRFEVGVARNVVVYCEVENFSSQLTDKSQWETKLTQDLVLYSETGLPVWNEKTTVFSDACRNRRRDFFLVKKIAIDPRLPIGRYMLKISVMDQNANRVAETSLPIQLTAGMR